MNPDDAYSKNVFDVWIDGLQNMKDERDAGLPTNAGASPEFPKVKLRQL
jgi:hypothetical protein